MKINIGDIRSKKNLSGRRLAKLSGISRSRLSDIENQKEGKTPPNLAELEALARVLNVRITELFESEYK